MKTRMSQLRKLALPDTIRCRLFLPTMATNKYEYFFFDE